MEKLDSWQTLGFFDNSEPMVARFAQLAKLAKLVQMAQWA